MKNILPLLLTATLGLAASNFAAAATTTATAPAKAQPAAAKMSRHACTKEAEARHLANKAEHQFVADCMAGKVANAQPTRK